MKRLTPLLCLLLAGCALFQRQAAPGDRVAQVEAAFTATVTALTDLRRHGRIADADWKVAKEVTEGIDATFEALHAQMDAGQKVDVDAVLAGIKASLRKLVELKTEAERERTAAASPGAAHLGPARNLGEGPAYRRAA